MGGWLLSRSKSLNPQVPKAPLKTEASRSFSKCYSLRNVTRCKSLLLVLTPL